MAFQLCPPNERTSPTEIGMPTCQGGAQACAEALSDIPKHMVTTTARTNRVRFFIEDLLDGRGSSRQCFWREGGYGSASTIGSCVSSSVEDSSCGLLRASRRRSRNAVRARRRKINIFNESIQYI